MASGRLKYLPPRFMTINTAIEQLLEAEKEKKEVSISLNTWIFSSLKWPSHLSLIRLKKKWPTVYHPCDFSTLPYPTLPYPTLTLLYLTLTSYFFVIVGLLFRIESSRRSRPVRSVYAAGLFFLLSISVRAVTVSSVQYADIKWHYYIFVVRNFHLLRMELFFMMYEWYSVQMMPFCNPIRHDNMM